MTFHFKKAFTVKVKNRFNISPTLRQRFRTEQGGLEKLDRECQNVLSDSLATENSRQIQGNASVSKQHDINLRRT